MRQRGSEGWGERRIGSLKEASSRLPASSDYVACSAVYARNAASGSSLSERPQEIRLDTVEGFPSGILNFTHHVIQIFSSNEATIMRMDIFEDILKMYISIKMSMTLSQVLFRRSCLGVGYTSH